MATSIHSAGKVVQRATDESVQKVFQDHGVLPLNLIQLITAYSPFFDFKKFYEKASISFTYMPKVIVDGEDFLTPEQREYRTRKGRDEVLSRMVRELEWARDALALEEDGEFRYLEAPKEFPIESTDFPLVDHGMVVSVSSFIGRRSGMEDRHGVTQFTLTIQGVAQTVPFIGVFDGNGGSDAAEYIQEHIVGILKATIEEFNPNGLQEEGLWNALKYANVRLNAALRRDRPGDFGSTVLFIIELHGFVWVVNTGDSRTFLKLGDMLIALTEDGKPGTERFRKCIKNRKGEVEDYGIYGWRLEGTLGIARGVGYPELGFKLSARGKITAIPRCCIHSEDYIVFGCDGNFEKASRRQLFDAFESHAGKPILRDLIYSSYEAGSQDNFTLGQLKFLA